MRDGGRAVREVLRALAVALALAVLGPAPRPGAAQEAPPIAPGTRLRATLAGPPARTLAGAFGGATDAALLLSVHDSVHAIPLATVRRLEVSLGRRPSIPAVVAGVLLGAAAGGAVGCAANRDSYGVYCGGQSDTKVAVGAVAGALLGGSAAALLVRPERWRAVDPGRLRGR